MGQRLQANDIFRWKGFNLDGPDGYNTLEWFGEGKEIMIHSTNGRRTSNGLGSS